MFRRLFLVILLAIAALAGGAPAAADPPPGNEWRVPSQAPGLGGTTGGR